jgi:hypothetical protein
VRERGEEETVAKGIIKPVSAHVERRLQEIRGDAASCSRDVRALAAYADHGDCNLATLAFASDVNLDKLLLKTQFEAPFGQSPFAIRRGLAFEQILRNKNYAAVIDLLRNEMGFPLADVKIANLRDVYPKTKIGMRLRAQETRRQLERILTGDPTAANLIDGAVLEARVGGVSAFFEADALAARSSAQMHVAEVKSFPKVDDRIDRDKLGSALDQVAVYISLVQETVMQLGGDPDRFVSDVALLITPKNVRMTPTLSRKRIGDRIARVKKLLAAVPPVADVAAAAPAGISFGPIADITASEERRLTSLHVLADTVGTAFKESCLVSCGNAKFCRQRAFGQSSPCLVGAAGARLLPGIPSLHRAADLSHAAPVASPEEQPVADRLEFAGRLYDDLAGQAQARRRA